MNAGKIRVFQGFFVFMNPVFLLTTPPGKGAIAVVTLYAEKPTEIVQAFFCPKSGRRLDSYAPVEIVYGTIFEEDVLVCPVSPNEMEIHCHGSLAAVARLRGFLTEQGAREITRDEWIDRKGELKTENQKRAFKALLNAETEKVAAILLDQVNGAYENALARGEDPARWDAVARHLTEPWKVVMVGRPNVGKSSLFNRILGFPRAIVFEQAGTTRDILREKTILDGWLVELVDTAGLHLAQDEIEIEGIRRARAEIERADLILWLRDASQPNEDADEIHFPPEKNVLTVWNKADLAAPGALSALSDSEIAVSALHETGISTLLERIVRALVPEEPLPGTGMRL